MTWRFNRRLDRMTGHDFPGVVGNGMHDFTLDELELGARAALQINDDHRDQVFWELTSLRMREEPGSHPELEVP